MIANTESTAVAAPDGETKSQPLSGVFIVVADDAAQLERYKPEWQDLASRTLEPNVFYEPWMLLPALSASKDLGETRFVLVFFCAPGMQESHPILWGFFPLQRRRTFAPLPVRAWSLWRSKYCALCVPLLDKGHAHMALTAFLKWISKDTVRADVLEMSHIMGEGPFQGLLAQVLFEQGLSSLVLECYPRGLLKKAESAEKYIADAISGKSRSNYRRMEVKLRELGPVTFHSRLAGSEIDCWIERFLELEASGWKGVAGTAFARSGNDASFFRAAMREGNRLHRVQILALQVGDSIIALQFNLLSGVGSFGFKVAFDEEFSRYSPGVLLQLHNIRTLHESSGVDWMDSCATPNHWMVNRFWKHRRMIQRVLVSGGSNLGDFIVAVVPLIRWAGRSLQAIRPALGRY